jgi:hypothetical protein
VLTFVVNGEALRAQRRAGNLASLANRARRLQVRVRRRAVRCCPHRAPEEMSPYGPACCRAGGSAASRLQRSRVLMVRIRNSSPGSKATCSNAAVGGLVRL